MIDYTQIWITDKATVNTLWRNPLLHFKNEVTSVSKKTGEIYVKPTKEFEGISFRKEPHHPKHPKEGHERLVIGFRPHYWYNGDRHNANNFTASMCIETVKKFITTFDIKSFENYPVNNLEYGLNFLLRGFGKELIGYNIYHSRNQFVQDTVLQFSKRAQSYNVYGKANNYAYSKFYAKGFQYPQFCHKDAFRFELGTKRRGYCKKLGIFNIGDLLKIEVYRRLKASLMKNAGKIFIIDHSPYTCNLGKRDENRLVKYSNSAFWYGALQQKRSATFNEKKQSYFRLLDRTGHNINAEFKKSISAKLEILLPEKRKDYAPLDIPKSVKITP